MANLQDFASRREHLEQLGAELRAVAPAVGERIDRDLHNLRANRFEVAVIGQFNAGKSTFLNAFLGMPGLLPTDINPWTAVITRCWLGGHSEPDGSGKFQFYTPEEWNDGVEPGANAQAAKQRSKFSPQALGAAVKAMADKVGEGASAEAAGADAVQEPQRAEIRRKAEAKLGAELHTVLGTTRTVLDAVDTKTLAEFVTAGGKYGEVTREADLYMAQHALGEPFLVVDTPGLNDPFQVRSAITKRYLAKADAYLVVLTALQALNAADKETLDELFRVMHKHRVIVLVNRIDQLNDGEALKKVVERVRGELKQWYPDIPIRVEPAAAYLGELAEADPTAALKRLRRMDEFDKVGAGYGWWAPGEFDAAMERPVDPEDPAQRQLLAKFAGVERARELVAKLVVAEKGEALLASAAGNLLATAESVSSLAAADAEKATAELEAIKLGVEEMKARANSLQREIKSLEGSKRILQDTLHGAKVAVAQEVEEISRALHTALASVVAQHARSVRANFTDIKVLGPDRWVFDVAPVLSDLERKLLQAYPRAVNQWDRFIAGQLTIMREAVEEILPDVKHGLAMFRPEPAKELPSLAGLANPVSLDIGSWWDRLWAGKDDARRKADELARGLEEAGADAVEYLTDDVVAEFERAWGETDRSWQVAVDSCFKHADQNLRIREAELREAAEAANEQRTAALVATINARLSGYLDTKAKADAIKQKFQPLVERE